MTRYFERFDGTAATVEDFLAAFTEVTGRDLGPFARWYAQAGTPNVTVETHYDPEAQRYRIDFAQVTAPTPGQPDKAPLVIPIRLGFVAPDGGEMALVSDRVRDDGLFVLDGSRDRLVFEDVPARPVPSLLRGFSAPVKLALDLGEADLLTLLRHDTDPFNRWQAAQTVALRLLVAEISRRSSPTEAMDALADAFSVFLDGEARRDPAFAALVLTLPSEAEIAQEIARDVDPDAVRAARETMRARIGRHLLDRLLALRDELATQDGYSPDAASAGNRALRNTALDLISAGDTRCGERLAAEQAEAATNMTDRLAALAILSPIPGDPRERAFAAFGERFAVEPLALDKWFALQAAIPESGTLARVKGLMSHPGFSFTNPNRVRSLMGSFALNNPTQFHSRDGSGYAFLAESVLGLNASNPQVAARLLTALGTWRMMEPGRRALAAAALRRIADAPELSPDVADIVQRSLAEA
jgi:aminopeptidase N